MYKMHSDYYNLIPSLVFFYSSSILLCAIPISLSLFLFLFSFLRTTEFNQNSQCNHGNGMSTGAW